MDNSVTLMLSQLLAYLKDIRHSLLFFLQLNIIIYFIIARSDIDRLTHRTATCTQRSTIEPGRRMKPSPR